MARYGRTDLETTAVPEAAFRETLDEVARVDDQLLFHGDLAGHLLGKSLDGLCLVCVGFVV